MFSDWGAWSDCSKTCDNGVKTRSRTCSFDPQWSGAEGSEETTCNIATCKIYRVAPTLRPLKIHILKTILGPPEFSAWSGWSSCSTACGIGSRSRTRSCTSYCSNVSSSDTTETESCKAGYCKFLLTNKA